MFWNDPKLYSANIPTNYFMPNREIFNYPDTFVPWQQFSHHLPHEAMLPPQLNYPRFDYPRFDYPRFGYPQFGQPQFGQPQFGYPQFDYPRVDYPRFDYPRFDYPTNYLPFMTYGFMDRPQFPFHKQFVW